MASSPNGFYKPAKPKSPSSPRNFATERAVCAAIRAKHLVRFTYKYSIRLFAPHVVRETESGNVIVYGSQISNSAKPQEANIAHTFTVSDISRVVEIRECFDKDPAFDPFEFRDGVICCIA